MWKGFIPAGRKATMLVMEPCLHSRIILPAFISKLRNAAVMLINFSLSSFFYCLSTFKVRIKLPFCHSCFLAEFLLLNKVLFADIQTFDQSHSRLLSEFLIHVKILSIQSNCHYGICFLLALSLYFQVQTTKQLMFNLKIWRIKLCHS